MSDDVSLLYKYVDDVSFLYKYVDDVSFLYKYIDLMMSPFYINMFSI